MVMRCGRGCTYARCDIDFKHTKKRMGARVKLAAFAHGNAQS